MHIVGTALHDGVKLPAGGMAEFGVVVVLENREFSGGVGRNIHKRSRHRFVIVVNTLDHEIVIHGTLTTH